MAHVIWLIHLIAAEHDRFGAGVFFCQRFVITNQIIFYDFSSSPGEKKKRILRSGTNVYGSMKPRLVWGCGNAIGISFELKLNVFTRVLF